MRSARGSLLASLVIAVGACGGSTTQSLPDGAAVPDGASAKPDGASGTTAPSGWLGLVEPPQAPTAIIKLASNDARALRIPDTSAQSKARL